MTFNIELLEAGHVESTGKQDDLQLWWIWFFGHSLICCWQSAWPPRRSLLR